MFVSHDLTLASEWLDSQTVRLTEPTDPYTLDGRVRTSESLPPIA